ncbi:hypothetical protein KQH62_00030 [bacterium]|nr:hypothetical protein [bacterium]
MTEEKSMIVDDPEPKEKPARKHKPVIIVFLLILLSILFVLTSVVSVAGYDIWRVAFNPTLVKQMLTDEFIDSALVPRVLENISQRRAQERIDKGESLSGVNEPDIVLLISFVDFEQWSEIKELLVTDEFVTHLVAVSVDGIYTWLDSPDPIPQFVWDMTPLKDKLVGQVGEDAIMVAYGALPECTDQQLADFESRLAAMPPGVEILYNLCQFPEPLREDQVDDYIHALVDINQNVPAEYDFSEMLGGGATVDSGATLVKVMLRAARTLGPYLWVVPLTFLALIAAIGVRSLRDAGRWLGIPLIISGGLVVGATLSARASLLSLLFNRLGGNSVSTLLRAEVERSFYRLSGYVFQPMWIQGAILAGVGLVLVIAWIIWGGKKKEKVEKGEGEE